MLEVLERNGSAGLTGNVRAGLGQPDHRDQSDDVEDEGPAAGLAGVPGRRDDRSYKPPMMKIPDSRAFCDLGMGRSQTTFSGMMRIIKSERMFGICIP